MFACNFLEACSFLIRGKMGMDLDTRGDGRGTGMNRGKEIVTWTYYVRNFDNIKIMISLNLEKKERTKCLFTRYYFPQKFWLTFSL